VFFSGEVAKVMSIIITLKRIWGDGEDEESDNYVYCSR